MFLFLKYYDLPDLLVYMGFIIHHRCWLPMAGINFRVMMCLSDPNGDFQESQLTFILFSHNILEGETSIITCLYDTVH